MTALAEPAAVRSPRTADSSRVQRRERAGVVPMPAALGHLAGTRVVHPFAPLPWMAGAPQCGMCWGWRDDYRHGRVRHG